LAAVFLVLTLLPCLPLSLLSHICVTSSKQNQRSGFGCQARNTNTPSSQIQGDDPNKCYGPKPDVQGGITAAMPGGSWLGALISGFLSDKLGRKRSIQVGAIIWYETTTTSAITANWHA
jgi:MFS family permease